MSGAAKKACQEDDKWAGWSARRVTNVNYARYGARCYAKLTTGTSAGR